MPRRRSLLPYFVAALAAVIAAPDALSCSMPRPEVTYSLDQLVDRSQQIVLARYHCKTERECAFSSIEVLRGDVPDAFGVPREWARMNARLRSKKQVPVNDFNGHTSPSFWSRKEMAHGWSGGSCYPSISFAEGETYLLFLDMPANPYAAELIRSSDDLWLIHVRDELKEPDLLKRSDR